MVHHALIKHRKHEGCWRYILSAPDADSIDEWWRSVSEKKVGNWKRLGPDFYSFESGNAYDAAPEINHKLVFTLLHDRDARVFPVFPHQDRTDHVSGQSFFIRSKSNPAIYWFTHNNKIHASTAGRTRFRIMIDGRSDSTVMIGTDIITISLATQPTWHVGISSGDGILSLGPASSKFLFSSFKMNFLAGGEIAENTVELGSSFVRTVTSDLGEQWELVK